MAVAGLMSSLRANLGRLASRFVPDLDERVFNRERNRLFPESRPPREPAPSPNFTAREPHIVIAPSEGPWTQEWGPAKGNYYYEVHQTAVERFGQDSVSVLSLDESSMGKWSTVLLDQLRDLRATHLISHLERDPGRVGTWTWDDAWARIAGCWDGAFVGVTFDSGFPLLEMKARRLARISPSFVCLDICVPMDGRLISGRPEIGPVPLVESRQTQDLLVEQIRGIEKTTDISFIGALYPYRVELIDALKSAGISVAVNPHRSDVTTDFASSRRDQPGWLSYMSGLAGSQMTINFSLASSGHHEQLKWRVIEATLAGTLLLTDDLSRTSEFFIRGEEFDCFSGTNDLAQVVTSWLQRSDDLALAQRRAQTRARDLAQSEFWRRTGATLTARRLPELPVELGEATKA